MTTVASAIAKIEETRRDELATILARYVLSQTESLNKVQKETENQKEIIETIKSVDLTDQGAVNTLLERLPNGIAIGNETYNLRQYYTGDKMKNYY